MTLTNRVAEILFKDQPAGLLEETAAGGTRFVYDAAWRDSIACSLPVERREHEWTPGLHPFFQHLAPEGWLREQQARVAHIEEEDDFGLLLQYGRDCIGAVSVRPKGGAPDIPVTEAAASPGRTVSGIQKKLLVVKAETGTNFRPADATGPAPYIAKFNSERLDTLVRNEALSLRWTAAVLGASEVTAFSLGHVAELNETALVVTRFDRTPDGRKLRLEDCAQILSKPRGQDYGGKYDAGYEDVAEAIKAHSGRPAIDLARFFRRLVAYALIGNCDAHLKNFSLLETPTGLRLSPAYDVVNTAIYKEFDQTFGLSIDGKTLQIDAVTRPILRDLGLRIGVSEAAIKQAFADLRRQAAKANRSILTPPPAEAPDGFVTRFSETVSRACLRILEA